MLFGKLLPREGNFFELFNQHASFIAEGARGLDDSVGVLVEQFEEIAFARQQLAKEHGALQDAGFARVYLRGFVSRCGI